MAIIYAVGLPLSESSDGVANRDHEFARRRSSGAAGPSNINGILVMIVLVAIAFIGGLVMIGYGPNLFVATSAETADSDINEIPPKPEVAAASAGVAVLPGAAWRPRLQQLLVIIAERWRRLTIKLATRTPIGTSTLTLPWSWRRRNSTGRSSHGPFSISMLPRKRRWRLVATIRSSCFFHVRSADKKTSEAELDRGYAKAAKALLASSYPPSRRTITLSKHTQRRLKDAGARKRRSCR